MAAKTLEDKVLEKRKKYPNLTAATIKTSEKARELGRQGGIASGKKKREKKAIKELYLEWLSLKSKDEFFAYVDDIMAQRVDHKARVNMLKEVGDRTETPHDTDLQKDADLLSALLGGAEKETNEKAVE